MDHDDRGPVCIAVDFGMERIAVYRCSWKRRVMGSCFLDSDAALEKGKHKKHSYRTEHCSMGRAHHRSFQRDVVLVRYEQHFTGGHIGLIEFHCLFNIRERKSLLHMGPQVC